MSRQPIQDVACLVYQTALRKIQLFIIPSLESAAICLEDGNQAQGISQFSQIRKNPWKVYQRFDTFIGLFARERGLDEHLTFHLVDI